MKSGADGAITTALFVAAEVEAPGRTAGLRAVERAAVRAGTVLAAGLAGVAFDVVVIDQF